MLSKSGGDDRVNPLFKLPLLDLSKAGADILREMVVNCNPGHAMDGVPEPLEIQLGLAFP